MASYFVQIFAFLLAVNAAYGITCYNCDSSKGVSCNYGLISFAFPTINCDEIDTGSGLLNNLYGALPKKCVKFVAVDKNDNEYVARSCAISTGPINTCDFLAKGVKFAEGKDIKSMDCWQCDENKCNSAGKLSGFTLMGLIIACFLYLF